MLHLMMTETFSWQGFQSQERTVFSVYAGANREATAKDYLKHVCTYVLIHTLCCTTIKEVVHSQDCMTPFQLHGSLEMTTNLEIVQVIRSLRSCVLTSRDALEGAAAQYEH